MTTQSSNYPPLPVGLTVEIVRDLPGEWERDIRARLEDPRVSHVDLWMEYIPDAETTKILGRILLGRTATAHAPFVDVSLTTADEDFASLSTQKIIRFGRCCEELGIDTAALHSGKYADFESKSEALKRFAERYEKIVSSLGRISLGVENLKPKLSGVQREAVVNVEDVQYLLGLNPGMKLTFDSGHAIQSKIDIEYYFREFGSNVVLAHIHDAQQGGHSHHRLGTGELSVAKTVDVFREYAVPYVTLELLNRDDESASLDLLENLTPLGS